MSKILVTTVPFADKNPLPLHLLEKAGIDYQINPIGRRLKEDELADMVADFDALVWFDENFDRIKKSFDN